MTNKASIKKENNMARGRGSCGGTRRFDGSGRGRGQRKRGGK